MKILVIGMSHHTSPVEMRERFAFAENKVPDALKLLRKNGIADEAVILSTCNRVEIYVATRLEPSTVFAELRQFLQRWGETLSSPNQKEKSGLDGISPHHIYNFDGPQSLQHLFKVACGLDSMVLGETEILGQLKDAYHLAHKNNFTGARLNKAFQRAFHVAKYIRTHTNIQRGSVSVASVGVELAEKIFDSLAGREVLVIGAGDTSEKVARALLSRGAKSIVVAARSFARAEVLAKEFSGRAVRFEDWAGEFEKIDIAISSTSAPHHILDAAKLQPMMKHRKDRPLLLIDIAVPRDVDPAVNFLENVYLYNIDDLQAIADDHLKQRKEEIARCEKIIHDKVESLLAVRNENINLRPVFESKS